LTTNINHGCIIRGIWTEVDIIKAKSEKKNHLNRNRAYSVMGTNILAGSVAIGQGVMVLN